MKNKLFVLLSVLVVALCATTLVACNKYNDEKLLAEKVVTISYGESVDFEKFNVRYYKDGETHPLTLKGKKDPLGHYDNPNGDYTWELIATDYRVTQLDVQNPAVGMYDLKLEYGHASKIVSLHVQKATYGEVISLSATETTKYLGDKIELSLSSEPENATITYRFAKCVNTSGEETYVGIGSKTKTQYDLWNKDTMFMAMFHVGKYRVYADISIPNYNPIVTEPTYFEVEKASLKGKYSIAIQDAEVNYISNKLGDYDVPREFILQPIGENPLPYELSVNEYSLEWDDPEQVVGLNYSGIPVVVRFSSEDFTLNDTSDTKEVTLRIVAAPFPYAETALFVDGVQYNSSDTLEYQANYELAILVAQNYRTGFVDVPTETFNVALYDQNENEIGNSYVLTEQDEERGYFVVNYEIVSTDGRYETKSGTFYVYFNEAPEPEPEPEPEP